MDNLSKDVKEALRLGYGCHYGRYKVDYPNTADHSMDVTPEPKHPARSCKNCGKKFFPNRGFQWYCGDVCRGQYNNREKARRVAAKKLPLGPAVCLVCGETYRRYKNTQTCCSKRCAGLMREENRRMQQMGD